MPALSDDQLTTITKQYNAIKDFAERRAFYEHMLFPALRDSFAAQPAADPPIEVLLLPVSNPHVPVLAAARWKPQVAFAIYSSRSIAHRPFIEQQIAELKLGISCMGQEVLNIEIEPDRLYVAIKEAIKPYLRAEGLNTQIAVDITGGTSVMSVGAAMAVSLVGGRFFYILSATAQDDIQQRQVGTEEPRPLTDPYAVFGDLQAAEARRLYAAHDYAGARRTFEQLAAHVPPPEDARYHALAALAALYAAWDVLDFATAEQYAATLMTPEHLPVFADQSDALAEQYAMLRRLTAVAATVVRRDDEALRTLADPDAILPLLGTLHAAALRRTAQERYDFAALFRYRCLELISQHRLANHGLLTGRADYRTLPMPKAQLTSAFQACQWAVGRVQPKGLPERIGLFDGYMLLAALDDPLVRGYTLKQIEERTDARNQSVLAHGYRLIGLEEYTRFASVVDEIIDRLFTQVLNRPRAQWEQTTRFIEL